MLRLLDSSEEVRQIVLQNLGVIAEERPDILEEHLSLFFVRFSEDSVSKRARLRIMLALTSESNIKLLLKEFLVGQNFQNLKPSLPPIGI
jgi:vesicle coat complex subunit